MKSATLVASTLIVLLTGCASHDEATDRGHVVIGSGSEQDRHDIEASNQQIFQTERAGGPTLVAGTPISQSAPSAPPSNTP